jgi:hypothetical protein
MGHVTIVDADIYTLKQKTNFVKTNFQSNLLIYGEACRRNCNG